MAEAEKYSPLATRSELFAGLSSSVCTNILSTARPMDFGSRQVIYFAGDQIEQIFLLTNSPGLRLACLGFSDFRGCHGTFPRPPKQRKADP